jgi:Ser/Thr protein kinase RdoA (MazF antagonist)
MTRATLGRAGKLFAHVAPLSTLSWEVRGKGEKPLRHRWSENHHLTRRVLAIADHSEQRLALAMECFAGSLGIPAHRI